MFCSVRNISVYFPISLYYRITPGFYKLGPICALCELCRCPSNKSTCFFCHGQVTDCYNTCLATLWNRNYKDMKSFFFTFLSLSLSLSLLLFPWDFETSPYARLDAILRKVKKDVSFFCSVFSILLSDTYFYNVCTLT